MALRKIDLMHNQFGYGNGKCADCKHLIKHEWQRTYFKCEIYGESNSEATDWRMAYVACGMKNEPYDLDKHNPIITLVKGGKPKADEQIDGQMSLFAD